METDGLQYRRRTTPMPSIAMSCHAGVDHRSTRCREPWVSPCAPVSGLGCLS
jgi:hypothetical protein